MNTYDECQVFGPLCDPELPEHLPPEWWDSGVVGVWCTSRGEVSVSTPWLTYYHMVAVTKTGGAIVFTWPLLNTNATDVTFGFGKRVADLFASC